LNLPVGTTHCCFQIEAGSAIAKICRQVMNIMQQGEKLNFYKKTLFKKNSMMREELKLINH
jgi:hypothetical protein